ncbi:stemmadenine O-acetyltransferase-like [Impatiens glandulifera]|uniref:stemmadenine O-acetyltransferase-like n=1 Tax=Impatiens glandulifera TaxID=253017 RepID=UPI001FB13F04|nr:stemmadenine O-acetyltransferase-like [Impatiens glandulifera]
MNMKIDIISKELIKPNSPTPSSLRTLNLSFLDLLNPPIFYSLLLFYSSFDPHPSNNLTKLLKTSLSNTLNFFYPLAGRLKVGESSIDCHDQGVNYVETRVHGYISDLTGDPRPDILKKLVVKNENSNYEELLSIQVNLFECGGLAIGVSLSHIVGDADSLCSFVRGWATGFVLPRFISAELFPPRKANRIVIPRTIPSNESDRIVTRNFVFDASSIAKLKALVGLEYMTTVEALTGLVWKCAARESGKLVAFHAVNIRRRMVPRAPEDVFGNMLLMAFMVYDEKASLRETVAVVKEAIGKIDREYIGARLGKDGLEVNLKSAGRIGEIVSNKDVRVLRFSSWCKFPLYEVDFGWGKPIWASPVGLNVKDSIFLLDSKSKGGVEVWVNMEKEDMDLFVRNLLMFSLLS